MERELNGTVVINSSSEEEMYEQLGVAHATDRGLQMLIMRILGKGVRVLKPIRCLPHRSKVSLRRGLIEDMPIAAFRSWHRWPLLHSLPRHVCVIQRPACGGQYIRGYHVPIDNVRCRQKVVPSNRRMDGFRQQQC